ncbi:hypothetical protein CL654_00095 [bacterium]|nr:hypothetical protein [bacterium]|tara:strand:+ start:14068 stop:15741 length:1674 start_codon:yes stop_codon:yes gene_type:complete
MSLGDDKITNALLKGNYLKEDAIKEAQEFAQKNRVSSVSYLLNKGLVTRDLIGQALSETFGVPYADLNSVEPTEAQVRKIPAKFGKQYRVILFRETPKSVQVTTDKPEQKDLATKLKEIFPKQSVQIAYSLSEDIDDALIHYRQTLDTRFKKIIAGKVRIAGELIDEILADAFVFKASDIHFEPRKEDVVVRFRVDGVLQEAGRIGKEYYGNVLNKIKIQSNLRIDAHFKTQDGSMRFVHNGRTVDVRTSIVPTVRGEKAVLRMLSSYVEGFSLQDLGLTHEYEGLLSDVAHKPFGMILTTGPTGSGKTTTLYSVLRLLSSPDVNVTTIEDPVEYQMVGVNQIQVNEATELTFSKGLRSIVRQDPDIILVGEIRDQETAEIAVNAALTGHLLLSTFHANDAATAIPRLLDMGIEPFLLSSTLEVIIAQRLVRKIHEPCRRSKKVARASLKGKIKNIQSYIPNQTITLYEGAGCATCNHTGFEGRTAIFEFIVMTPALRALIMNNPSSQQIWEIARKEGAKTLFEDGMGKVLGGVTTVDELLRVATPNENVQKSPKKK